MKIEIKGITLRKSLELLDNNADVSEFHSREDNEFIFDIVITGFSCLNYITPSEEDKEPFLSLSIYNKDGKDKYIFLKLDEYIEINIM